MTTEPLKSHSDLAARLKMPVSTVVELRKREQWPHVRIGRAVRFTDEQMDQIIASHITVDAANEAPAFGGQTVRSAKRRTA